MGEAVTGAEVGVEVIGVDVTGANVGAFDGANVGPSVATGNALGMRLGAAEGSGESTCSVIGTSAGELVGVPVSVRTGIIDGLVDGALVFGLFVGASDVSVIGTLLGFSGNPEGILLGDNEGFVTEDGTGMRVTGKSDGGTNGALLGVDDG